MTIDERQEELISQFELVDDWMDRYQMIIDLGDQLEPVEDSEHTTDNLIDGCQSRVWIIISPLVMSASLSALRCSVPSSCGDMIIHTRL